MREHSKKKKLMEVNPPQTDLESKNGATVVAAVIILEDVNNWRSVLPINILKKNIGLRTIITFCYRKCMYPLQYLSDMRPNGIYVWQKFWLKNVSYWVIIWIKFKVFCNSKCSGAFWLLLDPSCKGNLLTRVGLEVRLRLSPDAKNMAFPKNGSCIQILDLTLYKLDISKSLLNSAFRTSDYLSYNGIHWHQNLQTINDLPLALGNIYIYIWIFNKWKSLHQIVFV